MKKRGTVANYESNKTREKDAEGLENGNKLSLYKKRYQRL